MEDGNDTPAAGQQAEVLSLESDALPQHFSFDFSTNQSDNGSTSEESANHQMDLELPSGRADDNEILPAQLAEQAYGSQSSGLFVESEGLFVESEAENETPPAPSGLLDLGDAAKVADETEALKRDMKLEVVIPFVPLNVRAEYEEVHSSVVEKVLALSNSSEDGEQLTAELTDGTLRVVCSTTFMRLISYCYASNTPLKLFTRLPFDSTTTFISDPQVATHSFLTSPCSSAHTHNSVTIVIDNSL